MQGESFHPEKGRSHLQQAWGWAVAQMLEFSILLLLIVILFCAKAYCSGLG